MIINISGIWDNSVEEHTKYLQKTIDDGFQLLEDLPKPEQQYEQLVRAFIFANKNELLDSNNTEFGGVIDQFDATFPVGSPNRQKALELLKAIFDYGKFSDKNEPGWSAYKLCKGMRWKVCPYCHLHGTETVLETDGVKGYRPELDHFLAKSDYPYLALSLGNLIPACTQCNGPAMKHTKDFHAIQHLHPQRDAECIEFRIQATDPKERDWPDVRAFRHPADRYQIALEAPAQNMKAAESLKTFQLDARYQPQVRMAHFIARNSSNKTRNEMIFNSSGIRIELEDNLPFDPTTDEYKNEVAGKLYLDIYKQGTK